MDDTELLISTSLAKETDSGDTKSEGPAATTTRKQAWIQVVVSPELTASSSIFTFVPPSPDRPVTLNVPDSSTANPVDEAASTVTLVSGVTTTPSEHATETPGTGAGTGSHVIQIEPLLNPENLELAQALQTEKSYSAPLDIPEFGWTDCFQLGVRLTYITLLLRRNISPRILTIDEGAEGGDGMAGKLTATQIFILAHSGLAFNTSTQSLVICHTSPTSKAPVTKANPSKKRAKRHKKKTKKMVESHCSLVDRVKARLPVKLWTPTHANNDRVGEKGAIAVFRALRVNTTLLSLSLQHLGLGDQAMCALAAMLRCNSTLTKLDLQGNRIGPLGVQALCDAIEDIPDSMLVHLDLSYNRITDAGVPSLCRAFRENETVVWLNVSWNQLTSLALLDFLEAMRDNFVLSDVAMYGKDCDEDQYCQNHESKFAKRIAGALRCVNDSFDQLRLTSSCARLSVRRLRQSRWVTLPDTHLLEMDTLVIAGLLPLNTKLLTLDLSHNPGIERWAILEVLASIKHCKTLKTVNLVSTGLREEVAEQVAELVASNETLVSITMHRDPIQVQQVRGCHPEAAVEVMEFDIPKEHHFDRWILAKCLILNRPTQELNRIRLPVAPAETIGSNSKLVSVNLSGRTFDMYEVVFLSKKMFHHLHIGRVSLNNCSIESYGGIALADAVRNHATLETLEIERNAIGVAGGAAMAECVQYNASLKCLNLSWNRIGNDGAAGFRHALKANRSLHRLDLRGNNLSAPAIIAISEGLGGNACLIELHLRWNTICPRGAEALAQALTVNKALRVLDIEHHTMGEAGARAFALMLEKNTCLQELNMKGDDSISDGDAKGIGAEQAQQIAIVLMEKNKSLTNLNIAQNQIGKDGVVCFSNVLKFNKTLKILDLSLSGMDGKIALRFFECLGMNNSLVKLNLAHNRISNEGAMACLKALDGNKTLQDLNLTDNLITEEPLALLLQKLRSPKCAIALKWLCIAENSMTERTYQAFRSLNTGLTVVLEEEKHRGSEMA